jgi:hypothetical protein
MTDVRFRSAQNVGHDRAPKLTFRNIFDSDQSSEDSDSDLTFTAGDRSPQPLQVNGIMGHIAIYRFPFPGVLDANDVTDRRCDRSMM